jgi:activating signal cointegrator 1
MKAITIMQPYAELIARGEKRFENRSWLTHYTGPLAIHAGLAAGPQLRQIAADIGIDLKKLPLGAVVAVADLLDCTPIENLTAIQRRSRHAIGPYCWVLDNVQRLEQPIVIPGKQGLWNIPDEVADLITQQLR